MENTELEVKNSLRFLTNIYQEPDKIFNAIEEIQQPRSRFQIENFVIGQHDTKEMQYYQVCLELQDLIYKYRLACINMEKTKIEINRLRATGDEIDELTAQEKEIGLEQTLTIMHGAYRELEHLVNIWESFPKKFTREEIDAAQPAYWNNRLRTQAILESVAGSTAQASHLEALRQIGIIKVIPNEEEIIIGKEIEE
jgi:hypothetical protein